MSFLLLDGRFYDSVSRNDMMIFFSNQIIWLKNFKLSIYTFPILFLTF